MSMLKQIFQTKDNKFKEEIEKWKIQNYGEAVQ